jgi:hypothetical protein
MTSLLDLPEELLEHILSFNTYPICINVCKTLRCIEEGLDDGRWSRISKNYFVGENDRAIRLMIEKNDYDSLLFCLSYRPGALGMVDNNYVEYMIMDERLDVAKKYLYDYDYLIEEDQLVMLAQYGPEIFFYALSLYESMDELNNFLETHDDILAVASCNAHIDIVEYILSNYSYARLSVTDPEAMCPDVYIHLLENMTYITYINLCHIALCAIANRDMDTVYTIIDDHDLDPYDLRMNILQYMHTFCLHDERSHIYLLKCVIDLNDRYDLSLS